MADATATVNGCRRNVRPPIVAYKPSMWGDIFSAFSLNHQVQEMYAETIETLKKEVYIMLTAACATSDKLIDTLERLGLAYHFATQIAEKLAEIYNLGDEDCDLFTTALRFRLLRQH